MHNIFDKIIKHWEYGLGRTAIAAICAHSVSISIGICQGYSAILIPQLLTSESIKIDLEQASWLASFGAISNPIGSILSGLIAEWFGRKISMQLSSIPFIIGWICVTLSENIYLLYIGRLITGIAAGMATASYTYVSEISTPSTRGMFQALGPVSASFGILLTYSLGYFFHWKITSLISIIFALFTLITVYFLPESPSFLYKKKKKDLAKKSLFWFRRNVLLVQDEYNRLEEYNFNIKNKNKSSFKDYFSLQTLKPFLILLILFLLQEASGIYAILFYSVNFFKDAKIDIDEFISSIIVGLIRFVMSIFGAILINKFNRKSLCLISSFGMALSMFIILGYLKYLEITKIKNSLTIIPLICVLANVFFSMIGMLPIPWILVGELFSIRVRSIMMGLVICLAQIFIFITVKFYPLSIQTFQFFGTCVIFFVASILSVLFSRFVLPETKNKSLEEIEEKLKRKINLKNNFGVINKAFDSKSEINRNDLNGVFTVRIS